MIDLMQAGQDAVFAALSTAMPAEMGSVYQHVPQNAQPPYTVVGDIEAEPGETKGADRLTIEIEFIYRGKGRRPLLAMMHAARTRLDGQAIAAADADLGAPEWLDSSTVEADDGVTYAGLQRYAIEAEPA